MEISGVGNGLDPAQMAQNFFKKADANGDGGIDKSELKTMLSNGPGGSNAAGDTDKIFAEVDTNSDGKIDQTENANQMKKMGASGGTPPGGTSGKPAGGAPPSGGKAGGASSTGSSNSSDTTYYDKMDANKDGTVSPQEKIQYEIKHPEEQKKNPDGNFSLLA